MRLFACAASRAYVALELLLLTVCRCDCRKLALFLPHPVRHQDGQAKWDAAKQTLTISLPIIRDEW